ncbi:shikimate kinase [Aequitasia blattaphilus]|uniref:Shikimate kinase n=1 Tax=Aequitasia blattaphilus TaxID=2949332 RepID=A0ABT1E5D5_9FIRM|nr:shikimate kinase [Aequitasia blattaphilus]MCP1101040.1 shikimate kinase [Aequitasia blattaphilus]MCR8613680.1 shikimate kinase [Aequitasia blattaphilus]
MKKNNLILIGMPASGKSTIGVVAAKRMGYQFIDTDLLIQQQEKRLLKEIIEQEGIEGFLKIENQVNGDLDVEQAVISPGGSVIYCEEAMKHFKEIGVVVYLDVDYKEIEKRISDAAGRGVVLKEGQTLKDLYEERLPFFEKYADVTVSQEGLTINQTISTVMKYYETITNM